MSVALNVKNLKTAASTNGIYYPESDGQPMAETDTHIDLITYLRESLKRFFADRADVYVSGNIMFYYVEDVPEECVSPDIMVCFGVPKKERRTYKTWEENDTIPAVIFEISSRKTSRADRVEKKELYELLGVKEYFIFNPEFPKSLPSLIAYRLNPQARFDEVTVENHRVISEALNLGLSDAGGTLRLFDLQTNDFLPSSDELAEVNERLTETNQELIDKIELETQARKAAEVEIEQLKAELARLNQK